MDALTRVKGAVEAAGNLKLLEEPGSAGGDVVLVDRARRDERLIAVAESDCVEDSVDVRVGAVGGLGEGDVGSHGGLGAFARKRPDAQTREAGLALAGNEEAGEEIDFFKHDVVAVRDELGPVAASGGGNGRGDETEVAAAVIGANNQRPLR